MKKLPLYLRIGFAVMGIDPYAKAPEAPVNSGPANVKSHNPGGTQGPGGPQKSNRIGWTNTDVELPEYYKPVVVYTVDNEVLHNWARVNDGREDYYIHSTESRTIATNEVTHWMDVGVPNQPKATATNNTPKRPQLPK
jgi:hypothetical protein